MTEEREKIADAVVQKILDETAPDPRWEAFTGMQAEIAECKRDRIARAKWGRRGAWLGSLLGGGVLSVLVWAVRSMDSRADAAAEERQRIQMIQRHEGQIRALELQQAATSAVLRVRGRPATPEPDRGDP